MAKLNSFEVHAGLEAEAGIIPINGNDWPLLEAHSIQATEELRLDEKLDEISDKIKKLGDRITNSGSAGGGSSGGGSSIVEESATTPASYFTFIFVDTNHDAYRISCADANLKYIVIPRSYNGVPITQIDSFRNCLNLEYISMPDTITQINVEAFMGCPKLREVHVPDSVTFINARAFYRCPNLVTVTIPESVATINGPLVEKYHYLDGDGPYPVTVYCEATSKPSGWQDHWDGYRSDTKASVVWGADVTGLRTTIRAAEISWEAANAAHAVAASAVAVKAAGTTQTVVSYDYDGAQIIRAPLGTIQDIPQDSVAVLSGDAVVKLKDVENYYNCPFTIFVEENTGYTADCNGIAYCPLPKGLGFYRLRSRVYYDSKYAYLWIQELTLYTMNTAGDTQVQSISPNITLQNLNYIRRK